MKHFPLATLLLTLFFAGGAAARASSIAGDPISAESVAAHMEMARVADTLDAAVDAKDWALARSLFTEKIAVDFSSLTGQEPAEIQADDLIAGWSGNLTSEKHSFHQRSNHRIRFAGPDNAVMLSHGYAWNRMDRGAASDNGGDPLWEVWGRYRHGFTRIDGIWKISSMAFFMSAERGNPFVRDTPGR